MVLQLKSAVEAVEAGTAVVIANGLKQGETVLDIIRGKSVGTFITRNGHDESVVPVERLAEEGEMYPVACRYMLFRMVSASFST